MKSVDRLVAEHDIIERGLNVLEPSVARIGAGQPIPDGCPGWAPGFFAQFADMDGKFTQVEQKRHLTGMYQRHDAEVARWEENLK